MDNVKYEKYGLQCKDRYGASFQAEAVVGKLVDGSDFCLLINSHAVNSITVGNVIVTVANQLLKDAFGGRGIDPGKIQWFELSRGADADKWFQHKLKVEQGGYSDVISMNSAEPGTSKELSTAVQAVATMQQARVISCPPAVFG